MKFDKFTWGVIGVVVALLITAVVTVNLTGGTGVAPQEYIALDTPEAPIYNSFLAFSQGDLTRARAQYSARVLDEIKETQGGYDPFTGRGTSTTTSQRLRIVKSVPATDDPDRVLVSAVLDTYNQEGPFGAGSGWSRELTVEVVREPDGWKINTQEFFY
jgi:hypothetical protein